MTTFAHTAPDGQQFGDPEVKPLCHGLSVIIYRRTAGPSPSDLAASADRADAAWLRGVPTAGVSEEELEAARERFRSTSPTRAQLVAFIEWEREQANARA